MAVTFNDIRAACQTAQARIMRLQQATTKQVGLTSSIRDGWFEELRSVAQCFITAQQVSARLEQMINTEIAQLKGSLSSALNERDLRASERDSAQQEVKFLRDRLDELTSQLQESNPANVQNSHVEPATNNDSWITATVSNGASLQSGTSTAFPPAAKAPIIESNNGKSSTNNSFSVSGSDKTDNYQSHFSRSDCTNRGYRSNHSKFFRKNGAPVVHRSRSTNGSRQSSPDHSNGRASRFSRTPGGMSQGPCSPPPLPLQPYQRRGNNMQGHQQGPSLSYAARPFSYMGQTPQPQQNGWVPPEQPPPTVSRAMVKATTTRPGTPATVTGKELTLVRDDAARPVEFTPEVPLPPGSQDEERAQEIFFFFNTIKYWVARHCSEVNVDAMHSISHQYPRLWDYACSVTYPNNRHNAASHSLFMLCNKSLRTFFIARLVIQYIVQHMWSPHAWEGIDDKLTDILMNVKHRLALEYGYDAVLQPHERHALVDKRSRAIYDFMRLPNWNKCKALKVNQATNRLKDIIGPLMNMDKVDHQEALHSLNAICDDALRLSAVLNTSRLSFQFIFNECGIKFSEQSHRPLNTTMPTRELQAHHWRLMCVVTPGITYRNDAGPSVDPRFLAKANVLLMQ